LIIVSYIILTACSSTPKPTIATVSLNVQPNINPLPPNAAEKNAQEARPVVIRFYELSSLAAFNSTDFFSVFNDYKTTLDSELIASEELRVTPGQKQKFTRTLNLNTRYVGVVAAYKNLEESQWRAYAAIPSNEIAPEIYILLDGNKIEIGAKPPGGFMCQFRSPKPPSGTLYEVIE
ncbi:MAG: type VI secretion system lipoprotein TssJ, partial [Nitrosomonas sp.]